MNVPDCSEPVPVAVVKFKLVVVAVVIVAVVKRKFTERVLSADKSPPPIRPAPAEIVLDDETAEIPSEKAPVRLL